MKAEDLKGKTEDELKKLLLDARKEQLNQRFQRTQGSLEKTHGIRVTRRNIARIKTFLNAPVAVKAAPKKAKPAAAKKAAATKKPATAAKKD